MLASKWYKENVSGSFMPHADEHSSSVVKILLQSLVSDHDHVAALKYA